MSVQVSEQHVPQLMVGALVGLGALFALIVVLNNVHGRAGIGVEA